MRSGNRQREGRVRKMRSSIHVATQQLIYRRIGNFRAKDIFAVEPLK